MPNFHQVFSKKSDERSYLRLLTPLVEEEHALMDARAKIRTHLRKVIPEMTEMAFGKQGRVTPKFMVQGSWSYGTCNRPCHAKQEMDLDYGVYLPISAWEDRRIAPKQAALAYFRIIEDALKPLAVREGWTLDSGKDTCVRVKLRGVAAHVDVPLYVAPDEEFAILVEAVSFAADATRGQDEFDELQARQWERFTSIALAMRDGTWKVSDPRKASTWFKTVMSQHGYGEQYRSVCRFLKGLRDYRWEEGGPSSILLMICTEKCWRARTNRDDLSLLHVLKNLSGVLGGPVYCKEISDENFNSEPNSARRQEFQQWARDCAAALENVIEHSRMHTLDEAFAAMKRQLDKRFRPAPDLVVVDSGAVATAPIRPRDIQPQPTHRESRAG